jgi:FAD/FMN-containing dehydrogenase
MTDVRHAGLESFDPAELPAIDGWVRVDDATLAAASQDWGHIVQARPRALVRPASAADVAATVGFAASRRIPLAARGAGHSPFGQAQVAGGLVLDMTGLHATRAVTGRKVVVDAGARWRDVLAATLQHGLAPPVLTDYLDLTVGGTLAVGGIGGASQHYGAQTDTLVELEVVTGTGEPVTCSAAKKRRLFDAVRAGLGQCAVVTRATIRLRPAPARARRWKLFYDSLRTFLTDQRIVVGDGRFGYLEGQILLDDEAGRWRYMLEGTAYYSPPDEPDARKLLAGLAFAASATEVEDFSYLEFLDRMAAGERLLRADGSWFHPHPWLNLFLPDGVLEAFVAGAFANVRRTDLGGSGLVLLYPLRSEQLRTPLIRVPTGEVVWLLALLPTGDPYDPVSTARMIQSNAALYLQAKAVGGTVYPANALPMTPQDWQEHFGAAWPQLASAKRQYDPQSILAPGQGIFA